MKNSIKTGIALFCLMTCESFAASNLPIENSHSEVITITGKRPLRYFKQEMLRQEVEFYSVFNSLIKEKKFKVRCRRGVKVSGTLSIRKKHCEPDFMRRRAQEYDNVRVVQSRIKVDHPYIRYQMRVQKDHKELMLKVEKLIESNPQLRAQLLQYDRAKATYENERKIKFGDGNVK